MLFILQYWLQYALPLLYWVHLTIAFLVNQDKSQTEVHDVLFLSIAPPTQSESAYPCNFTSLSETYLSLYPIVPFKYLNTCFVAIKCTCLGSTMYWLKVFTTKHISNLLLTRYIKDPIICLYIVGSARSEEESLNSFTVVTIGVAMDCNPESLWDLYCLSSLSE